MSLPHASSGDVMDVRPLGARLERTVSNALFKTDGLEVMRLVLATGKSFPEHTVTGEVTIQCLEGEVELDAHQKRQVLHAGEMAYLAGGVPHALHALVEASLLITIVLKK